MFGVVAGGNTLLRWHVNRRLGWCSLGYWFHSHVSRHHVEPVVVECCGARVVVISRGVADVGFVIVVHRMVPLGDYCLRAVDSVLGSSLRLPIQLCFIKDSMKTAGLTPPSRVEPLLGGKSIRNAVDSRTVST